MAKKSSTVPKTAAVKEAEAALQQANVQSLDAQKVRVAQQSRGAVTTRRLRSSGTDLQGYLIGGFKDDPMPKVPSGGGSGGGSSKPKAPTKPKAPPKKPKKPKPTTHKQAVKKQTKMSDARGDSLDAARKRAKAALQAKKRAASKAGQSQQRKYRSKPVGKRPPPPAGKAPKAV